MLKAAGRAASISGFAVVSAGQKTKTAPARKNVQPKASTAIKPWPPRS
jgi:hypothetical protein